MFLIKIYSVIVIIFKHILILIKFIDFNILMNKELYNKKSKEQLRQKLNSEAFDRTTCSFYKYVELNDIIDFRDRLYIDWNELKVLGRVYLSKEGVNAQVSIPNHNLSAFKKHVYSYKEFENVDFKVAIQEGDSFYKLNIKIKDEIVAYKIANDEYDMDHVGQHLNYKEFNNAINNGAIVVDVRNYYEGEVGKFENAIIPDVDASIELLPEIKKILNDKRDEKILMYCTGGIRCEKASAYLIHHGFKDVNQLKGGIIQYANDIKENNEDSKFIGKNFVFDHRLGERITEHIIGKCHQCNKPSDMHTNCVNQACHILFIQCKTCASKYDKCCSMGCSDFIKLSIERQKELFKAGKMKFTAQKSNSIKPKLYKVKDK